MNGRLMRKIPLRFASRRVPEIVSVSVAFIAGLVLIGWATDAPILTNVVPVLPPMPAVTAVGLILGSVSLWLLTRYSSRNTWGKLGALCALMIALLGVGDLISQLVSMSPGVNRPPLRPEWGTSAGRLSVRTALGFLMSGIALLTLHVETRRGSRPAQFLALTVAVICLLTVLSYGYGIGVPHYLNPGMGAHTSVCFILLSAGILSAYPDRGLMAVATSRSAGGFMFRRLALAVIGVPSILGWLIVAGTDAKLYPGEFGVALLVAANVVLFLIVIWRNAHLLHVMDGERQQAAAAIQRSNEELESRVENRTSELREANEALQIEVAERRRVTRELRHSQEELADFFENATVGLHWVGRDGTILRANRAELDLLGYERNEYVGHNINEFHVDQNAMKGLLRHLSQRETVVDYPAMLRAKDGSIKHVLINSNVMWEGERFIHTRCFTRDITDAKRIEDERNQLLIREQALREQAEQAAEVIRRLQMVTDTALSHLTLDELLHEMLGRIRELLRADAAAILLVTEDGKYLTGRAAIGLEEEARVRVPIGRGVAGRIAMTAAPVMIKDLSKVEVMSSILSENARSLIGAPLMIEGRVIGVMHVDTLETHNFTAEDLRLLQLAADRVALAIEHARLYEAEQRARVEAETASRMKDEFLATISHELRSPLNSILGWVTLMREGRLRRADTYRALETVERSARAQNRIISDLLDVSRIINGQLRLNMRSLEPGPVVEAGVDAVRPAAAAKGIQIRMSIDREAGRVAADADRLQQIVWNLVSNAIKFTPSEGTVEVRLERIGSEVEMRVSDTGAGISPDFLPFVFDRFRQADSSSTRKQGGLGLGLAIVRHLVELHGGTVHAESQGVGKGAAFVVRLPLVSSRLGSVAEERVHVAASSQAMKVDHPPRLEGLRVLVVDDEANARDLVSTMLAGSEADVRTAASAAEAMAILRGGQQWRPDVLVSDIEMPDADGYDLIRCVRTLPPERGGHVPAVALTAHAQVEDRMKALAAGFQMHVPKPIEQLELLTVLGSVTGRLARSTGPLSPS
jgi:PAS domain S-box-containing protein